MSKHEIVFREEDHSYTVDGQPAISVTQILKATGISKPFDEEDEFLMKKVRAASERGNYYDRLAEEAVNNPFELNEWQERFLEAIHKAGLKIRKAQPRFGTLKPFPIAGTGDFIGINIETKAKAIIDLKATYEIYKNSVTWQTNTYSFLDSEEEHDACEKYVIHYSEKIDKFTILKLAHIKKENVLKLFQCYQLEEVYAEETQLENIVDITVFSNTFNKAKEYEELLSKEQEKLKDFYSKIEKFMEESVIKTIELEDFKITYTPNYIRRAVDFNKAAEDLNNKKLEELNEFLVSQGREKYELVLADDLKETMTDEEKVPYTKETDVKGRLTVTAIKKKGKKSK